MTVSSERLSDIDAQLEALGVSEDRISEVRARVADGFSPDLARIDDSLAELSADLEGLDAIVAEARTQAPAAEPSPPVEADSPAPIEEAVSDSETPELDIEELDIDELDMDEVEIEDAGEPAEPEAPPVEASTEPESPFDEPLPEIEAEADDAESDSMSAQDLFDQAMEDDSEAPGAIDDLAHMLEEEVSASGDVDAPAEEEPSQGESDIESLLGGEDEIQAMAEPSALVDLASLEADEGDSMVEIGAALDEEAAEDADAPEGEGDDDDDPEGGEKKGFFKKLFG